MKWQELIQNSAWIVDDLLTFNECEYFLNKATEAGISKKKALGDVRHRNSQHTSFDDVDMAEKIYERIKNYIPQEIIVKQDCENNGLKHSKNELYGRWVPYGLNYRWRVICYPGVGHFGPHRDGCHIVDENNRSLITINGYLTDRPTGFGGATRFLNDAIDLSLNADGLFTTSDDDVLHRVEADKAGKAVVFLHDLMHDGEPLKEGSPPKWLFRTEIMFKRDPESAPQMTCEQKEARKLLKEAEISEMQGDIMEAIKLYNRAYKLDISLDYGAGDI